MSLVIFGIAMLFVLGGLAGLWLDPGTNEESGGLGWFMLMAVPVMCGCPLGLLLGLLGSCGKSRVAMVGAAGNALLLVLLFTRH
jgi:hypothetical protein